MLASARPKGEPMATPPICHHVTLLKINLTDLVAVVCISKIKTSRAKGGAVRLLL